MEDDNLDPILAKDIFVKYITLSMELREEQNEILMEFVTGLDRLTEDAHPLCMDVADFILELSLEIIFEQNEVLKEIKTDALADRNAGSLDARMRFVCHLRRNLHRNISGLMLVFIYAGEAILQAFCDRNIRRANDMVRWTMEFLYDEKVELFLEDDSWDMYVENPPPVELVVVELEGMAEDEHDLEETESVELIDGDNLIQPIDVFLMYIARSVEEQVEDEHTVEFVQNLRQRTEDANPLYLNIVHYIMDWCELIIASTRTSIREIAVEAEIDLHADSSNARERFIERLEHILHATVESLMLVYIHAGEAILTAIRKGHITRATEMVGWTEEFLHEKQVELVLGDQDWELYARGNASLPFEIPLSLEEEEESCNSSYLTRTAIRATWIIALMAFIFKCIQDRSQGHHKDQ